MGSIIAVLSGKGGTGKTSVCAGVAIALAEAGSTVLCIDCDVGLRNLDISLGMSDNGTLSFLDVLRGGYPLEQAPRHSSYPSLAFLTAPVNVSADEIDADAKAIGAVNVIKICKVKGKLKLKNWYFEQIIEEYYADSGRYVHPKNVSFVRFFEYVKSDGYGREMYVVNTDFEEYSDKTKTWYSYTFLVIVQPNESYDVSTVVVLDQGGMSQQVKTAKQQTGWNTPL